MAVPPALACCLAIATTISVVRLKKRGVHVQVSLSTIITYVLLSVIATTISVARLEKQGVHVQVGVNALSKGLYDTQNQIREGSFVPGTIERGMHVHVSACSEAMLECCLCSCVFAMPVYTLFMGWYVMGRMHEYERSGG